MLFQNLVKSILSTNRNLGLNKLGTRSFWLILHIKVVFHLHMFNSVDMLVIHLFSSVIFKTKFRSSFGNVSSSFLELFFTLF
jgi:hypothetical protein